MDTMTVNKWVAGILVALLLVKGAAIVAEGPFHVEAPETPAYAVALPKEEAAEEDGAEAEPEGPALAALLAAASADKGARVFAKCVACHNAEQGGANKIGPNLYGMVGAEIGGVAGFNYSDALASHDGRWTYSLLDAWLESPKDAIPGNKMAFAGLAKPEDRADLIAFLRSRSDDPPPLPTAESAAE